MKKGFTLIETIAVLLLVGILAAATLISLLPMTAGLQQVRANTASAQKARLAMARLAWEFTTISNIVSSGPTAITYEFLLPNSDNTWYVARRHSLSWGGAGTPLVLQDVADNVSATLSDDVANFNLDYAAGPPLAIDVTLQSLLGGNTYSNRIVPRNIH